MYAMNVLTVGVDPDNQPAVKKVLTKLDATIETDFAVVDEVVLEKKKYLERHLLLIVQLSQANDAERIQLLRDTYSSWPIIAIVPHDSPPNLVLALNRAGADQIITSPVNSDDLEVALEIVSKRFITHPTHSTVISITGTVPGCGVSTIALNLADLIAHSYRKHTLLVESAQQMATQAINLNLKPQTTIADLLIDPNAIDATQVKKAMLHVDARFDLLSGPMDITAAGSNSIKGMPKLVQVAREVADVVVIDVVATFDDLHFETLWASDQIVLVLEQTIPSIRAAAMMKDALMRAKPPKKLYVVLNKYDPEMGSYSIDKIKETLGIHQLYSIPHDRKSALLASAEGKPLRKIDSDLAIVKTFRNLTNVMMGMPPDSVESKSNLLHRLARFLQT